MYKCGVCPKSSVPGEVRLLVTEHRMIEDKFTHQMRQEVKKETPVCRPCYEKHMRKKLGDKYQPPVAVKPVEETIEESVVV
jgi:hypothetical protein